MIFSRRIFSLIITTICLLNVYSLSIAQTENSLGNWNTLNLKARISHRFSLMGESQVSSRNYNLKYNYFEVKAGISCDISRKLNVLFGSGIYNTYQTGGLFELPAVQKELRTWLELNFKQLYKRLIFEHRVRIEQRFIPENYKNRFRYRFGITLPVNKLKLVGGCLYIVVNDELWRPQYGPFLEKNRFFAGAGYKLNENTTFQAGCMSDTNYTSESHTLKNYLQLVLMYDFSGLVKKHP
jgi:hypothetical protein